MIFYTDFIPKKFAAITIGPFIFIRPAYKNDVGLHEHERIHVKQFWRTLMMFPIIYLLNAKMRYKWELEAYRVQLAHSNTPVESAKRFACFLSKKYRLNITHDRAYSDLMGR